MSKQTIDMTLHDETARRIAACVNAFEGIPTDRIEGKNLGEILAGEVRLNGAGPRADGGFGFEFSGGVCQLMAEAYAEQFRQSGAINYLELLFNHSDIGPLTITMQRVEGLTPAQKLAQAEAQRDELQQKLDTAEAKLEAAKSVKESWKNRAWTAEEKLTEQQQKLDALSEFRSMIFGALGVHDSHEDFVARVNIENALRRANCLSAIERHFTFEVEDEEYEGEMMEQCPLNWGQEPEVYIETFKSVLNAVRAEGVEMFAELTDKVADEEHYDDGESSELLRYSAKQARLYAAQLRARQEAK